MILIWHHSKLVLMRIVVVALALGALAMALDLAENAPRVLASGEGGMMRYLGLRAPTMLTTVAPVALIVGPVLAFLSLAARNEFTILRAAGVTTYRLIGQLVPLAVCLGIGFYLMVDRVTPRLEATLIEWLEAEATAGGFWARTTTSVVRVGASSPDGRLLADVDIYETDRRGRMLARIDAKAARYDRGVWRLEGATRLTPGSGVSAPAPADAWASPLTPANIRALAAPGRSVAGDVADRVLAGDWAGNRSVEFYRVRVYRGYAALITPLVMLLLAAPAAYGLRRAGGGGRAAVWAVALGFGYLLVDGMLASLGESGNMPPALAAFGAAVMFGAIGLWMLLRYEEG